MRVSVFGVGYVGCVTAACLAREGHDVIGVDVDPLKIAALEQGRAPFFEPGLNELVAEMVKAGRLRATVDHVAAVRNTDIALVCVGTPALSTGSIQLDYLKNVLASIGKALRDHDQYFVVALRSTVLPTAIEEELMPLLGLHSGKKIGSGVGLVFNPEFLREGTALKDFYEAPWTVVGSPDSRASDRVAELYANLSSPLIKTSLASAALLKYFCNAFHALKVAFANEVGYFCREMGADSKEVMEIFCQDAKLNISRRYLMPGFAFGGSCLPKDLKALMSEAGKRGLDLALIGSILESNEIHLRNCIQMVTETKKRKIGIVGLTFKEGTDDLRESPAVELAERLIGKGFDILIHEPSIGPGKLHGTNLRFLEQSIPHIWKLLAANLDDIFRHAEVVVVTQQLKDGDRSQFKRMQPGQLCIDLARTLTASEVGGSYRTMDLRQREGAAV